MEDSGYRDEMSRILAGHLEARAVPEAARPHMDAVLRSTLEQIDICAGLLRVPTGVLFTGHPIYQIRMLPEEALAACQGVPGAYSHIACTRLFSEPDIRFYSEFEDVFSAVAEGEAEFGVLPVENSSAGAVTEVLSLVYRYGLFINATIPIQVEHCFCVHPDTDLAAVTQVISHPQALLQCGTFLRDNGYSQIKYSNTAAAAQKVAEAPGPVGCLCSELGAELYGLRIVRQSVQDHRENYTRFLCVSRENILLDGADTVAITLAFPNEPGYLSKLLTRFALCNLDLTKLLSMPIASKDFLVRFFLDFRGSIQDPQVERLLNSLAEEFPDFRFLGNFLYLQ